MQEQRSEYTEQHGEVVYLDATPLKRPQAMPKAALAGAGVFVVIAIAIGAFAIFQFSDNVLTASKVAEATVEENLSRDVSLDLPNLGQFSSLDDAAIAQSLADAGIGFYEISSGATEPGSPLDLFKLPSDVSVEQAAFLVSSGISNLTAEDASLLLNGSWRLTRETGTSTVMRVRYADFASDTIDEAIANAIASQGFDAANATEAAQDDAGNTFREGVVNINGTDMTWRVSALSLDKVYDIPGLPTSALYVGIRLTYSL